MAGQGRQVIGDRWGVTADEMARRYPCDEFVGAPVWQAWRGVTIAAPVRDVWPWVIQIRLAPYSYDCIDNLGRRSPQELHDLVEPEPGQHLTTAGGRRVGRVLSVQSQVQLTGRIMGTLMSYVLVPDDGPTGATRLLLKVAGSGGRQIAPLLSLGDLLMARRQLLNLKGLAERRTTRADV
jgi:hypothetical protein